MSKKSILQKILAILAKATIRRYKPVVVGITGSVGKTSTREAIFTVLKSRYRVRRSEKNYNTEIGLPLTVLGLPHHGKNEDHRRRSGGGCAGRIARPFR